MRLSEWRTRAPHKDSMTPKVIAVIEPVLHRLGAEADPSCWVVWGDDPDRPLRLAGPDRCRVCCRCSSG